MEPLVTVGIPTYNNAVGLRRTLACITGQSYKNLEIIVSDNHSENPDVPDIIANFCDVDKRIRAYRQPRNIGVDWNYRWLMAHATGKYLMFAQDDDLWTREVIEKLVAVMEQDPNMAVAMCSVQYASEDGTVSSKYYLKHLTPFHVCGNGKLGFVCMGLWRRELYERYETHLPDTVIGGDHITAAHVMMVHKIGVIDSEVYLKGHKKNVFAQMFKNDWTYPIDTWAFLIKRLIESEHISFGKKMLLPIIACTNLFWTLGVYGTQLVLMLPEHNTVRKKIQKKFFGVS